MAAIVVIVYPSALGGGLAAANANMEPGPPIAGVLHSYPYEPGAGSLRNDVIAAHRAVGVDPIDCYGLDAESFEVGRDDIMLVPVGGYCDIVAVPLAIRGQ